MAVAVEQLIETLEDSGVIAHGKLERFIPPQAHPQTAEQLVELLVQAKQLTRFQAQEVFHGRAKSLILGNYTILDKIGAGGMGAVYKAEHRRMQRVVAIKIVPKTVSQDAAALANFQREVETAAKLEHPNIIAVYDADQARGVHFLVMQYVEGADLETLVRKLGPMPPRHAVAVILQVAKALEYAGSKGVADRTVTASRVLVDNKRTIKLLNMGLSRLPQAIDSSTAAEARSAQRPDDRSLAIAPTRRVDAGNSAEQAAIESLARMLKLVLTGQDETADQDRQVSADATQLFGGLNLAHETQLHLVSVYEWMVAPGLKDRQQSMSQVVADLELLAAELSPPTEEPLVSTKAERPPRKDPSTGRAWSNRRSAFMIVGAGVLAVAVLVGSGWLLLSGKNGKLVAQLETQDADVKLFGENGQLESHSLSEQVNQVMTAELRPGKYRMVASRPGFVDFVKEIEIKPGEETSVQAVWTRKPRGIVRPRSPESRPSDFALHQWHDVLKLADLDRHAINGGQWFRNAEGVAATPSEYSRLILPVRVLGDYDVSVAFTRKSGGGPIIIMLPIDENTACALIIAGHENEASGIAFVNGLQPWLQPASSAVRRPTDIVEDHRYSALVHVVNSGADVMIQVDLDDQPYLEFTGPKRRLSRRAEESLPATGLLAIGTNRPGVVFHDLQFKVNRGAAWRWPNDKSLNLSSPPEEIRDECVRWNGKWYWMSDQRMSFNEAVKLAERLGGRLLEVKSRAEQDWIAWQFPKQAIWLNAFRRSGLTEPATGWQNDRCEPLSYFGPWGNDQPDHPESEFRLVTNDDGRWHDFPLDTIAFACVEWGDAGALPDAK